MLLFLVLKVQLANALHIMGVFLRPVFYLVFVGVANQVRVPRRRLHDIITAPDQFEILRSLLDT